MDCASCPCFELIPGQQPLPGRPKMGNCTRFPPTVVIVPGAVLAANAPPNVQSAFPITPETGHCWEYPAMKGLQGALEKAIAHQMSIASNETKN